MAIDPRESYRSKVLVGFAVVLVVGVALSAVTVTSLQNIVQTERTQSLVSEADVQGDTVQTLVIGLERSAVTAADTTTRIRDASMTELEQQSRLRDAYQTRTASDQVSAIHLVNPQSGEVVVSSNEALEGGPLTDIGYGLPDGISGDAVIRFQQRADETAVWVVYTTTPSGDVLVQVTPYAYVQDELEGVLDESHIRLVNGDGEVVYDAESVAPLGADHTGGPGVSSPAVKAGLLGETGTTRLSADESPTQQAVVTGYDGVEATDWAVVSYAEPSALFAAVGLVQRNLLLLVGGIGLSLLAFGLAVERPTAARVGSLRETVGELEAGNLETTITTDRRDEFGDLARGLDSMRSRLRDRIEEAERAQTEAEAARQEAEALSTELETKADEYRGAISSLAEGDFTVRVDPDSRHDGMQEIGETLNAVIADLEETVADVQQFADEVADSMTMLSASADEIETSSADVADTVQSISGGTEDQREQLQTVVTEMNDMSATVEEIASTASEVAGDADTAAALSRDGRDAAEDASAALDEIETVTQEAVGEVEQLVEQVSQIEEFADVIGDVAEQTDMLALNANIEAARTDTDADGFAVVADEIKSLATEAGERADDIERLVGEVGEQTDATAERMQEASDRLRTSNDTVESAIETLIEIGDVVESTNQGVQDINRATDDQAATTEEVTATVEEIEAIAATNANEANQAAAAAEEQTATVSEVARTADEVAEEAESLREAASQFTVSDDPASVTGDAAGGSDAVDESAGDAAGGSVGESDAETTGPSGDATAQGDPTPDEAGGDEVAGGGPAAADGGAPDGSA